MGMTEGSFELFDHTADVGITVRAPTMPALLRPAAVGLYHVIGELRTAGKATVKVIEFTGSDPPAMLCDFLTDLLIYFERDHLRAVGLEDVQFTEDHLHARCTFLPVDMEGSSFSREVKAITYHELDVYEVADGWEARVIVDI